MRFIRSAVVGGVALAAGAANAAVDTSVSTALSTAAVDAATVGAGVILIVLAVKAVKWLRSAL
ncbi:major capsid protein [Cupriavidus sp. RAF20_2]|uniref:major capsid protein n=1 Tax=Cupriavidus sp. RAF20_2 TaxID=3233053 RepID=UPI003F931C7A